MAKKKRKRNAARAGRLLGRSAAEGQSQAEAARSRKQRHADRQVKRGQNPALCALYAVKALIG